MKKRLCTALKEKKGYTLVELIAAFALTLMLVTVAAMTVPSYIKMTTRINSMALAQNVSDTICDTLEANISAAADSSGAHGSAGSYAAEIIMEDKSLTYTDHNGYKVTVYVGEADEKQKDAVGNDADVQGLLVLKYSGNKTTYWFYGKDTYMGAYISNLKFSHPYGTVIKFELEITTNSGYSYNTERYIDCYNLVNAAQITEGAPPSP